MMWGDNGYTMSWWWIAGGFVVIILVVVIVVAVVLASTRAGRAPASAQTSNVASTNHRSPRRILDERYAAGELTTDEYQEHVHHLDSRA